MQVNPYKPPETPCERPETPRKLWMAWVSLVMFTSLGIAGGISYALFFAVHMGWIAAAGRVPLPVWFCGSASLFLLWFSSCIFYEESVQIRRIKAQRT